MLMSSKVFIMTLVIVKKDCDNDWYYVNKYYQCFNYDNGNGNHSDD